MRKTSVLRKILDRDGIVVTPGVYDAVTAKIVEHVGFESACITGAGVAASSLGMPDTGLVTLNDMLTVAARIVNAVDIPIVCDGDTGYGNAINVMRTIRESIQAGVAAILIEDQVFPKRCGHTRGKLLVSKEEMLGKIRAADDTRREMDPDFILIARCDARTAVGGGIDEVIERGNAYARAGADIIFPESPLSIDEMELLGKRIDAPLLANMIVKGGLTPLVPTRKLRDMGYVMVAFPLATLQLTMKSVMNLMAGLKEKGIEVFKDFEDNMVSTAEAFEISGFQAYLDDEEKYLPKELLESRYKQKTTGLI
ncbi:hypothetical protein AC482_04100 [miscellaneous Crenarchaeota group-15 archaeon DG-45]|uniref:Carboxyvinyl-carboxyphosphonate phosphorylmutase n=1 Tax=miscellaneous Crenarchaeota group-15 archaeon DG-45 TaxID=1685127 RepID=A0A0M0BPN4_9ARCH|nr:MAG: hypothetical protein AC482_04100 [miscellaneous Crenarchaeota group-15 archaeon DG-45]